MYRQFNRFTYVFMSILLLVISIKANEIVVYTDTLSAGWNYMDSCITFEIQIDSSCKVSWTVIKMKKKFNNDDKLTLTGHPFNYRTHCDCSFSFHSVIPQNKLIIDSIFSRWPPFRFSKLAYTSFRHGNDYTWNIPIALLSAKSEKYKDFHKNYPNTKYNINGLFVEFANESNAYQEFTDLLKVYGLKLNLTSVEKVFTGKVKELTFGEELIKLGLQHEDKVIWDIGMSSFSLEVISNNTK